MKHRPNADAKGSARLRAADPSAPAPLHAVPPASRITPRRTIVQKFGGTSVGSIDRIRAVARRVVATQRAGADVVVVVSAMAGETNRLLALAKEVTGVPDRAELDVIAASGEQVAAGLLALAIMQEGAAARSFLGHQVRVVTDASYGDGRVQTVEVDALRASLARGEIPVVTGFQGVDAVGRTVTLGRGGSDTSAVVVAAALSALCEIYTDVDGVYAADPSTVPGARKLASCSLDDMLVLAENGAKVLHPRSVAIAKAHGVTMVVRSTFTEDEGTLLTSERTIPLEGTSFVGIAQDRSLAIVQLTAASNGEAMRVVAALAAERITVDMVSRGAHPGAISFALPEVELERALRVIEAAEARATFDAAVTKLTIAGSGLANPLVVGRFLDCALAEGACLVGLIADDSKIQCVVDARLAGRLTVALYAEFFGAPSTSRLAEPASAPIRCTA